MELPLLAGLSPMTLSQRLAENFHPHVRRRGESYNVRIRYGSIDQLEASVRVGQQSFEVDLGYEDGVLNAWCDCEEFVEVGPCAHLWAVLEKAGERGYLSAARFAPELILDWGEPDFDYDEPDLDVFQFPTATPGGSAWRNQIAGIVSRAAYQPSAWPEKRQIVYLVDPGGNVVGPNLDLAICTRDRKVDGKWGKPAALSLNRMAISTLPDAEDREILSALASVQLMYGWNNLSSAIPARQSLTFPFSRTVLLMAMATGRCYLGNQPEPDAWQQLSWDEADPWQFRLEMRKKPGGGWSAVPVLVRGEERTDVPAASLIAPGIVFARGVASALAEDTPFEWLASLAKSPLQAKETEKEHLLIGLLTARGAPPIDVPPELRFEQSTLTPKPRLVVRAAHPRLGPKMRGDLRFDYDGRLVESSDATPGFFDAATRRFERRNLEMEREAASMLEQLGVKYSPQNYGGAPDWAIAPTRLPAVVRSLVEAGWHVEAEGKTFRRPGAFQIGVSSGIDWFELHGKIEYGETEAKLPALLEAARKGDGMVRLDDGTYGILPDEFLKRFGALAGLGDTTEGQVRFRQSQAGLLDALLATQPEVTFDETFRRMRDELRRFEGVTAAEQPPAFRGMLREYQREGLGWMHFLRRFSFGGCLADDMGVGKTAQVLALLETRRELRESGEAAGPSLVVVPKSLVFNWKQEAERFTPRLRVLDYTGGMRTPGAFEACDVVLTTYGTLRRDAIRLKDIEFDYIVLDEAQAIKNAATESAKAARLLHGRYRLALSGTPVENHLGELWSLFEFLNPGMLGAANVFKMAGGSGRAVDPDTARVLAQALRPFILRRTKEQVARELPEKTEQTVYCEMEPGQRRLYHELREHYRTSLLRRIETEGLAKSKIQVLEALLRLRQAACHPGLLDPKRSSDGSAKLDMLLEQLKLVIDEGHKALVFSQFTSLLDIVRKNLDKQKVVYEYLDGSTHDRQRPVERFQNSDDCRIFLISLKAGGLGLNLTAAGYVFLLDPWWNPAVEAQAVDRAHRIGQTRQVFAYRLIARDTVEEKVLELQKSKRDLAAAIIGEDNRLIGNLRREDLELLLS